MKVLNWKESVAKKSKERLEQRLIVISEMGNMTKDKTLLKGLERTKQILLTQRPRIPSNTPEAKAKRIKDEIQLNAETNSSATKSWRPWSSADENLVMNMQFTDDVIAKKLGRSLWAVRTKRRKLYKRKTVGASGPIAIENSP